MLRSNKTDDEIFIRNASELNTTDVQKNSRIVIGSDVGDLIGALNDGNIIEVRGNAGKYAADGMTSGEVLVNGDADEGAGSAMCGGTLVIKGNAKNRLGQLLKGGTIIVAGNAGHRVASFMIAGTVVIGGNAGRELGSSMIGGAVFLRGSCDPLGRNLLQSDLTEADAVLLSGLLSKYQISLNADGFKKITASSSDFV